MTPAGFEDVTDATDFRSQEMQALERALRCGVCKDFFDRPVLVPQCGHSFCSMCVRDYLASTAECPSCRTATSSSSLLKNSMLEHALFAYRASRPLLLSTFEEVEDLRKQKRQLVREAKRRDQQLVQAPQQSRSSEEEQASPSRPSKRPKYSHGSPLATLSANDKRRQSIVIQDDMEEDEEERGMEGSMSDIEIIEQPKLGVASSSSSSKGGRRDGRNQSTGDKSPTKGRVMKQMVDLNITSSDEKDSTYPAASKKHQEALDPIVKCPLCNFKLPCSEVDAHIENGCAQTTKASGSKAWSNIFTGAGGGTGPGQTGSGTRGVSAKDKGKRKATAIEEDDPEQREPIPKVTWSVTKDKTLRELLEHHGLPTDGDRKKQERRYDRWIALHNTSLDTEQTRKTLSHIRGELREWEKIMNASDAALIEKKRKEREGDMLDEKKYLQDNKAEIAKLVAQARASATARATIPSEAQQRLSASVGVHGAG